MNTWPRQCACCRAEYSRAQWNELRRIGSMPDEEGEIELRDCSTLDCRNTISIFIPIPSGDVDAVLAILLDADLRCAIRSSDTLPAPARRSEAP